MIKTITLILSLFLTIQAYAENQSITVNQLINHFNSVAFINEHGQKGNEIKPLTKWTGPIIYSPSGTLTKNQLQRFLSLMNQIKGLTNLDMRFIRKGEKANLVLYFVPNTELVKMVPKGINCYGSLGVNANFEIIRGRAYIPSDRSDKTDHCLIEEMTQLFGLTNDSPLIENSIFNEQSSRTSLSASDQILLKVLYDPRLKSGMTKDSAQPTIRTIITDIITKMKNKASASKPALKPTQKKPVTPPNKQPHSVQKP